MKSKRLQGELGWRGPAIVLAQEGHTRLHLSYRGVSVLVTPEQCRHSSRAESEMVEHEDLIRQMTQWRGGSTLQKGFVDERGPAPPRAADRLEEELDEERPMWIPRATRT